MVLVLRFEDSDTHLSSNCFLKSERCWTGGVFFYLVKKCKNIDLRQRTPTQFNLPCILTLDEERREAHVVIVRNLRTKM